MADKDSHRTGSVTQSFSLSFADAFCIEDLVQAGNAQSKSEALRSMIRLARDYGGIEEKYVAVLEAERDELGMTRVQHLAYLARRHARALEKDA